MTKIKTVLFTCVASVSCHAISKMFAPFPIRNEVMRHISDVVALGFSLSFSHAKNLKRIHSGPEYSVTIMRVSIKREEMISIKSDI